MRSLRHKIIVGFAAVGVFVVGLSLLAAYEVWRMERGMVAEEAIAALVDAVADIRRLEKNYFLYRDPRDLDANRAHADSVRDLLADHADPLAAIKEPELPQQLNRQIDTYLAAMADFSELPTDANELRVRSEGKVISGITARLADRRRDALHAALRTHRWMVIGVVIGSLVMLAGLGTLLSLSVTHPLKAVQRRMEEVAAGAQERVELPSGDAEIRSLVAAINTLLDELELRRQQMVVSQKLASLGVLLSGVAHELNNPLSNISTSCQILLEEDEADPEFRREHLAQIDDQTERARRIVSSLLDLSRHQRFMKEPVALRQLVDETLALVRGQIPSGVAVNVQVPDDLELPADRQRLQQVLINLVKNAAEASGSVGRIALRARLDNGEAVLEVADDGCGIGTEDLAHVFDPFYTTKDVGKGSGLGLFIVHDIIEKHGGRVGVVSAPGQGTTFLIRLPVDGNSMAAQSHRG